MHRRTFLQAAGGTAVGVAAAQGGEFLWEEASPGTPPAASVIPVVGDGRWIWKKPPENQTGYLEPRKFSLRLGIELVGRGNARGILATTTAPIDCPQQKIESAEVRVEGCRAGLRPVAEAASQFILAAPAIVKGQRIAAWVDYELTLFKDFRGFSRDCFPAEQNPPREIQRQYLGASPGIDIRAPSVRQLHAKLHDANLHPWDQIRRFRDWVRQHIRGNLGVYRGLDWALKNQAGDCEEMSVLTIALGRLSGIPSRLVWVPNHNWSEIYLQDQQGQGHWIPIHTAAYSWFGWTGAHELILQKGDRLELPERRGQHRLLEDWVRYQGRGPEAVYTARLTPVADGPTDIAGPGAREKTVTGEWKRCDPDPTWRAVGRR